MSIDSSWSFFLFCFCWIALIVGAVLGYLVGSHQGKRRERYRQVKEKIRANKDAISRYQREKYTYFRQLTALQEEMENQAIESERYEEQQANVDYYRQKVRENEHMIRLLDAENTSLKESGSLRVSGYSPDVFSLLEQMKEDPVHTNLSRADWMELIRITDKLFNRFLTGLTGTYALTRHEQEICCLIKWNFTRREQMALFNNTTEALTKSKGRLKKRLQLDEGTDLDQYIRLYG